MNTSAQDDRRNQMWRQIFGLDYLDWDKDDRRIMKAAYAKERGLQVHQVELEDWTGNVCTTDPVPQPVAKRNWYDAEIKKENAMNSAAHLNIHAPAELTQANLEANKRSYLETRMEHILRAKDRALEVKFGLVDQDAPKTPKEFTDRIKSGNFVYSNVEESDDEQCWLYTNPSRGLRWRDPSVVEDKKGYQTAYAALRAESNLLLDTIRIKDPVTALADVQAWEVA